MNRVVITGMGVVSPVGNDTETLWNNVKSGCSGIGPITRFDTTEFESNLGAEVKDFQPELYFEKKLVKRMDLYTQYGLAAAIMATRMAGLDKSHFENNYRVGIMVGSGIGGLSSIQENVIKMKEKGPGRIAPLFIPMAITNMLAGIIAIELGIVGPSYSVVTACATGVNSIGDAFRQIKHGYLDVALAGGAEASITEIGMGGFISLTALSKAKDPDRASLPFNTDRAGFVMGEGAGVMVLESLEHAKARGAKIYGEVVGFGCTTDAYHMTAPRENGEVAAVAITQAIEEAGITPSQVGYVNAHGTGTELNDIAETKVIHRAFGEYGDKVAVSSTKSMTGHLLGAAGAIEAIITACALSEGFLPPTIGLDKIDPECNLNHVAMEGRSADIQYALSNSMGFGGHNAVICLKKWEE